MALQCTGMADTEQLRQQIHSAFPADTFLGSVTNGCKCGECVELARSLSRKRWDAIESETINRQFGSLPLLSSEAFSAFLPAWLMRSLDSLDADEQKFREWTLYALALYHDDKYDDADELPVKTDRLLRLYQTLTPEQVRVVEECLLLIRDHAHITDWDRESINRALHLVNERSLGVYKSFQAPTGAIPGSE